MAHVCTRTGAGRRRDSGPHEDFGEQIWHCGSLLTPSVHRGQLWGSDGFISVPRRGDRPRRVFPGELVPRPRLCPTQTVGEKRSNSAEKTSNFLTERISPPEPASVAPTSVQTWSRTWCPPWPRVPASPRCACRERDRFPTLFRSPNLSECAVDPRGRAVTRSKSFRGSAHISGRANCDVGWGVMLPSLTIGK